MGMNWFRKNRTKFLNSEKTTAWGKLIFAEQAYNTASNFKEQIAYQKPNYHNNY